MWPLRTTARQWSWWIRQINNTPWSSCGPGRRRCLKSCANTMRPPWSPGASRPRPRRNSPARAWPCTPELSVPSWTPRPCIRTRGWPRWPGSFAKLQPPDCASSYRTMTRLTPTWIAAVLLLGMISSVHALLPPPDTLRGVQDMVREAVAKVRPSVVAVRAQKQELAPGGGEMWFESVGSGIVVDQHGHVLTNSHVVRGASRISVVFWDQPDRVFTARVTDDDPDNDLALLLVESGPALHPAPLGHASTLGIGQWVVSVGSPYGYDHSASLGIISGLHRNLNIDGVRYRDMIQTDAVINQGSSGGPLINANGRVVGINTAVFSPDNAYAGISFAIPVNRAKQFLSRTLGAVPTVAAATMPSPGPSPATPGNAQGPAASGFQHCPPLARARARALPRWHRPNPLGPLRIPKPGIHCQVLWVLLPAPASARLVVPGKTRLDFSHCR
uniref:Magnetosome protein MamEO-Nter n=1 Tax=delta proteobacterium ML-1 TaxID=947513 RepID=U5IHV7_9DELT|nr:magnetosome protein MamEO-Nter [delta proteobacterium ML-1]